ncbi:DUF421 domain-containing protein [Alteribacter natronophilus]|uniref:DUF421 domain-containing protein n=1 Tax=Alteribacter natronophilus TaxID=2583810 RepID=UPI00110EC09D|nr:DUF421 domain-containing protein [Alteribacter natronophilus]TMW73653.1 DUF421 domain-containing protein [Alteribacter natronophilus]
MAVLQDLGLIVFRISTILPILLAATLFMGKRSIGALPVFDFLVIMTLASVTGADLANPDIQHIHTVAAILGIAVLQRMIAYIMIKSRRFEKLVTFEPTIVVHNGRILPGSLKKLRYSADNILQMLREKNVFDPDDVEVAIVEGNGNLSVRMKPEKDHLSPEDLNISKKSSGIAYPVILEGKVYEEVLFDLGLDREWLRNELLEKGVPGQDDVFYAAVTDDRRLHISLKDEQRKGPPFFD